MIKLERDFLDFFPVFILKINLITQTRHYFNIFTYSLLIIIYKISSNSFPIYNIYLLKFVTSDMVASLKLIIKLINLY